MHKVCTPSVIGNRACIGAAVAQADAVDTAQAVGNGADRPLRAGVVIALDPVGFQIILQNAVERRIGKLAFQPVAAHNVVVAAVGFVGCQQQQNAVVLLGIAQPPGVEHLVGYALHGGVADHILQRVDADLRPAGFLQLGGNAVDVIFGIGGQNIRVIRHGVCVGHRNFGGCQGGQCRRAGQRQRRSPRPKALGCVFHKL